MISAMTERPANTPRPIGRTESFFPGMVTPPAGDCKAPAAVAEAKDPEDEDTGFCC